MDGDQAGQEEGRHGFGATEDPSGDSRFSYGIRGEGTIERHPYQPATLEKGKGSEEEEAKMEKVIPKGPWLKKLKGVMEDA